MRQYQTQLPEETERVGAAIAEHAKTGDVFLLHGELGAGKTTLVRGFLRALGYAEPVRSPTFALIQLFETDPPVLHADLYRGQSHRGLGLEDYLEDHVCFVEWPDRADGLFPEGTTTEVHFEVTPTGRTIRITPPGE